MATEKILIRYEGRSEEFQYNVLDMPENPTDGDVKVAVERHMNLSAGALSEYEVDHYSTELVIRPQAKFGN